MSHGHDPGDEQPEPKLLGWGKSPMTNLIRAVALISHIRKVLSYLGCESDLRFEVRGDETVIVGTIKLPKAQERLTLERTVFDGP